MGLYRDETGRVIEIDDRFAEARGYAPVSVLDENAMYQERGLEARGTARGLLGSANAALTGVASGFTLGGSDYLLGKVLPDAEREQLLAEMEAHPYLRAGGEIAGTLAAAMATGGSSLARTPTGYLSQAAQRGVESGLAGGGVKGTAKALGVMGTEGAIQSAGQYIGHASLEDKEVTAEGLTGALGTGFAFGAVGGGAALGVTNGAMAGRRLFSRVMGGKKAAAAAESSWSIASQEALTADLSTARTAEAKLESIRVAKMEALRGRNEARSAAQEAALDAQGVRVPKPKDTPDFEAGIPTNVIPKTEVLGGTPTSVFKRPGELEGPDPLIDVGAQPAGEATSVFRSPEAVAAKAAKDAEAVAAKTAKDAKAKPAVTTSTKNAATDLEAQLAGTKAKLDEGASIKDIHGDPAKPARKFNENDPMDLDDVGIEMMGEMRRGGRTKEGLLKVADDLRAQRQQTLSEIRFKATEDLLGTAAAKQEQILSDLVDEFHAARKGFEEIVGAGDGAPGFAANTGAAAVGSPGKRQAIEILDDAHEEALLRARHASDPQEAGRAITEAEEIENLLDGLTTRPHQPDTSMKASELMTPEGERWAAELLDTASKVTRYEKASAALSDEAGDVAHPMSSEKTKSWREAERDSERKMYDRTARATDDAADGIHPKVSAAKAARKQQIDAQRKLDDISVQHTEAKNDLGVASKKVREGEKLKAGALREDAKLARGAGGIGAQDVGSIMELIDIPGMPKPSDLPIIGPLLGAYLKFRTIKKAMGRAMGKVPATADARVAVLASQTRDRVARAVDRSIGALERGAKGMTRVIPPVAGVLAHRIFDDGGEDPKKGAGIQDLAAARMRELASYVHTPGAIERDVRRQLAEVTDPDLITAAEKQRRAQMEFLLSVAPKVPEPNLLNPVPYRPAPAQAMSFARSVEAVNDPASVFERLAHEQAMISLEAAEALRKVYPRIFSEAGLRLMERAQAGDLKVPMRLRVQLSLLYKVPLDSALDPDNLKITQSVYDRKVTMPPPGMQGAPASPSIANPVNLSQGLTPAADRR